MKAVVVSRAGGPEVLEVLERELPSIKPGWSLVKVMGFGINHSGIFYQTGLSPSVTFPRVLGIEMVELLKKPAIQAGFQLVKKWSPSWERWAGPTTGATQSMPSCQMTISTPSQAT